MVNYSAFHYSEKARKALEEMEHIKESIGQVYIFRGSVDTVADLPNDAKIGEVYDVLDSGTNYAWTGDRWDSLGAAFDLSEYAKKEYVDTTEQDIIKNYMDADTALQTQITGLSGVLDAEQDKITAIEGKIPTNASTSNMLSTASDLLNATQDVRGDFADADSELQTQINGQATAISELQDDVMANMGEIADIKAELGKAGGGLNNKITNCITEIPQDIKLELNNSTLTLKAGSKVYVPNGFEADGVTPKFDEKIIQNDITAMDSWGTNGNALFLFVYSSGDRMKYLLSERVSSGTTPPSATNLQVWYDVANNLIKGYQGGTFNGNSFALPIALVSKNDGVESTIISGITKVFNGFGYVGSTVFALPGVKGLIPNGRNEDGSLKSNVVSLSRVLTFTSSLTGNHYFVIESENNMYFVGEGAYYDESINKINDYGTIKNLVIVASLTATSGVISNWNPKTTFHAVDYNDKSTIVGWCMPDYSAGISKSANVTHTAEQDGFIKWGVNIANNGAGALTINGTEFARITAGNPTGLQPAQGFIVPIAKGSTYYAGGGISMLVFYPLKGAK